ncbi:poly-gamma-glutamate biosynthesis protein PgsC/CapC [Pseudoalteromonas fenneropenaei]|uniref:Poly-gamma-glutamate biosynthesis protein PgsC/CapC n=1 Tax=Pseudoalteromonas fenneropenaei TaxID=1737459 RepID=A0ABV7CL55_9GAMM
MDWTLALFPEGGGLGQSVITTVWIGVMVVGFLNLRFGFPLTGLVVPGYLVPLFISSPTSAVVILVESVVVFGLMRLTAKTAMEHFGYAEMFGRDRFFAIILLSILVRVVMDTLLWPSVALLLSQWDISFDYASELYSLGLVIIALTANVMWNGGFRYGVKVTAIQLALTYVIVRYGLMGWTNFSIANLSIMYEAVAASIVAAPKAYIILVITAFLASRANIKYGWEFNGIMLPALLALQLTQPSKLITSFIETGVILLIGGLLLSYTRLRHANFEGARLLMFFFNIGFAYKLLLNYWVVHYYPALKVTDTFAFGYMLSTLLALKIYQKNALGLIIRATLQTSVLGGFYAIAIGFLFMFVPSLLFTPTSVELQPVGAPRTLSERVNDYKSVLFTQSKQPLSLAQLQEQQQLERFSLAVKGLARTPDSEALNRLASEFAALDFILEQDDEHWFISDRQGHASRGLFVLNRNPHAEHVVLVPFPNSERLASDSAIALYSLYRGRALVLGNQQTPRVELSSPPPPQAYVNAFLTAIGNTELVQLRETNKRYQTPHLATPISSSFWIYNQIPNSISQRDLLEVFGPLTANFGLATPFSLPTPQYHGQFIEIFINSENYATLLAKLAAQHSAFTTTALLERNISLDTLIAEYTPHISAKGSYQFQLLSFSQAALWENEILKPLFALAANSDPETLTTATHLHLNRLNAIAFTMGYQLQYIRNSEGHFVALLPRDEAQYYQLGQGMYVLALGKPSATTIQVPRPLFESNTLKFAAQLFSQSNAELLLIAGAHPFASPTANVMSPDNVTSLFNVVHQSAQRYFNGVPILNLQIRSHSAPSSVRPSAIAFQNTFAQPEQANLLAQLETALRRLGVEAQWVQGQSATRGLELGTSPQSGYQQFSTQSELATLWLAADFKQQFSISAQALEERLLSVAHDAVVYPFNHAQFAQLPWAQLTDQQRNQLQAMQQAYLSNQHVPYLYALCQALSDSHCKVVDIFQNQTELALLITNGEVIYGVYLPTRNKLLFNRADVAALMVQP